MKDDSRQIDEYEYFRILMYLPDKLDKCINLIAQDYLKDSNLKNYYLPYIFHIKNQDGISQKELKQMIPFDKSRISVVVNELIEQELIYDDGTSRSSSLHLTKNGENAYIISKMLFDIVGKEIFQMSKENYELIKQKNIEFNDHLDQIIARFGKT